MALVDKLVNPTAHPFGLRVDSGEVDIELNLVGLDYGITWIYNGKGSRYDLSNYHLDTVSIWDEDDDTPSSVADLTIALSREGFTHRDLYLLTQAAMNLRKPEGLDE